MTDFSSADPAAGISTPPLEAPGAPGLASGLFARFVAAEDDVVGLLAYALHRQNRHDWLDAFHRQAGREPDVREAAAFRVGEGIERRLAGYRAQAERMLEARTQSRAGVLVVPPGLVALGSPEEPRDAGHPGPAVPSALGSPTRVDPAKASKKIVAGLVVFVLLVAGVIIARRAMGI